MGIVRKMRNPLTAVLVLVVGNFALGSADEESLLNEAKGKLIKLFIMPVRREVKGLLWQHSSDILIFWKIFKVN